VSSVLGHTAWLPLFRKIHGSRVRSSFVEYGERLIVDINEHLPRVSSLIRSCRKIYDMKGIRFRRYPGKPVEVRPDGAVSVCWRTPKGKNEFFVVRGPEKLLMGDEINTKTIHFVSKGTNIHNPKGRSCCGPGIFPQRLVTFPLATGESFGMAVRDLLLKSGVDTRRHSHLLRSSYVLPLGVSPTTLRYAAG